MKIKNNIFFYLAKCKGTGSNDCNSKDDSNIKNEETGTKKELGDDDPIIGNKQKNTTVEKEKDNSIGMSKFKFKLLSLGECLLVS